jgi:para-aminobenzoate synthetase component 1
MRQFHALDIPEEDFVSFKEFVLSLSRQFNPFCVLESNNYLNYPYSNFGSFIAFDSIEDFSTTENSLDGLYKFHQKHQDWLFGYLTYDLKNQLESDLSSNNEDGIQFPIIHFFVPRYIVRFYDNQFDLGVVSEGDFKKFKEIISNFKENKIVTTTNFEFKIHPKINKETYIQSVEKIKEHIQRGDIYEVNFCQEFYAENAEIDPLKTYQKLIDLAKAPFCAFYKTKHHYLLCSSPERYLKKIDKKVISQPIKGTIKRGSSAEEDDLLIKKLQNDPKEKSENIMIVDLVRNDLSRVSSKGSVQVEELLGVYTFNQVHQLISTITGAIEDNVPFTDAIKMTFPMGSMTGAPKISAMQIIEQCESFKRGLYSGAVGYITPKGNFDFNVVIRSILYNSKKQHISIPVGSAITHYSDPQQEYEECLVKAKAMFEALKENT